MGWKFLSHPIAKVPCMAIELNFTKTAVDKLPFSERLKTTYRDNGGKESESTLYLYVGKKTKSFYFVKKARGEKVEYKIGTFPAYPIDDARKKARALAVDVDNGTDPRKDKRESRTQGLSLEQVIAQYLVEAKSRARKPIRASTAQNYQRVFSVHFSKDPHVLRDGGKAYKKPARGWSNKPAKAITVDAVEAWYKKATAYSVTSANSAVRFLRAAYNHQIEISRKQQSTEFTVNPFAGIKLIEEKPRSDYLEPDQLKDWMKAVEQLSNPVSRDYLKLLLFTGMRRREAAKLKWSQVDMKRRVITLAESDTKNSESLEIPLSDYLLELLAERKRDNESEYVFPSSGKSGHLAEPRKPNHNVNSTAGTNSTIHGLRRTYSNIALWQAGIPDIARKLLLNHALPKNDVTAQHYTDLPLDQKRKYQQAVTDTLLRLAEIKKQSRSVVSLESVG